MSDIEALFWIYIRLFQTEIVSSKIFDKRNNFEFDIVNFLSLDMDVSLLPLTVLHFATALIC